MGTIVHANPQKSIATIEYKPKNTTVAVAVGNNLLDIARIEKVTRFKVYLRNLSNNRLEYVEFKDSMKLKFSGAQESRSLSDKVVKSLSPNRFEVKKSDVERYTKDLPTILQQAAMVPVRSQTGEIEGFRFVGIQPDSIYTQLGFQVGDVIKAVNGEVVDSPTKAIELYQALKDSPSIRITVERNGQTLEFEYNIR